jgi:hypothetical protein
VLKKLGQLKKSNDLIGNRNRYLPASSIESQKHTFKKDRREVERLLRTTIKLSTYEYVAEAQRDTKMSLGMPLRKLSPEEPAEETKEYPNGQILFERD